jgi:hypothetical protein
MSDEYSPQDVERVIKGLAMYFIVKYRPDLKVEVLLEDLVNFAQNYQQTRGN